MKRITIRDIAKMLSVSPSTVSRALSNHPDISQATKNRVNEVASAFNYTVNLHSNFFRNKKSNLIALVIPEINMFFTPNMIKSINKAIVGSGYSLFIFVSNDNFKKEKQIIDQCIKWAVEGVLISLSNQTKNISHLNKLSEFGISTVLLDRMVNNKKYSSVTSDSFGSSYKAVEHLILNGHKRIIGLFGNPNLSITKERISGFRKVVADYKLDIDSCVIITMKKIKEADEKISKVLEQSHTAIFAMSDEILAKTHFNLIKMGKRTYTDISLIAISDGSYPYLLYPNVSFIKDSGSKMGRRAMALLLDELNNKSSKIKKTKLRTKLVKLDSVKDIRILGEVAEDE